jgi:Fe2+ transport system protein FeoA
MELAINNNMIKNGLVNKEVKVANQDFNLTQADINVTYTIKDVDTRDNSMKEFLFTLGCFEGEEITVISVLAENFIVHVKDARYSIDEDLARAILI